MKIHAFIAVLALLTALPTGAQNANFHTVPLPKEIRSTGGGTFQLTARTLIVYTKGDADGKRCAEHLKQYVKQATGLDLMVTTMPAQRNCIRLTCLHKDGGQEHYSLRVNSEVVWMEGATGAGLFYAVQTLRKALPTGTAGPQGIGIPATEIKDAPHFGYRGAHMDVARHFVTADSIRRFIDMLALHGLNRFHWHLTDDQGWRIEIKKYPRLTAVGSQRKQTVVGRNTEAYDGKPYGGFYTQKEIRELVKYAADRYVTIVPEIDMPGHMQAALAAYPELGCTGGPYEVWTRWGVTPEVLCAGNDKVLEFADKVLEEVTRLFPSHYVHIGGDECPKERWDACPRCQARIAAEGLQADGRHTAGERLQSFFIKHVVATLQRLGRQAIGWDETLEGGLAPGAAVMSWRGEGGGIEAARAGHDVIMTPCTHLYFDYYQSDTPDTEPLAGGGFTPVEAVYAYDPVPACLTPEQQHYIKGVQANLWTEYVTNYRHVEYMELPRLAALAEIAWCEPQQKNFDDFTARLLRLMRHYRLAGYTYSRTLLRVKMQVEADTAQHALVATLSTADNAPIYYTLHGETPTTASTRYAKPFVVKTDATLCAAAERGGRMDQAVSRTLHFNPATACPVEVWPEPHADYRFGGAPTLTDGEWAPDTNYRSGKWLGWVNCDPEVVIDLGVEREVSEVAFHTCVEKGAWIFDACAAEVSTSTQGSDFKLAARADYPALTEHSANDIYPHSLTFAPIKARYVKVKWFTLRSMPHWHPGKGHPAFVFVDEVIVK